MTTPDETLDNLLEGWSDLVEAARELQIHPQSLRRLIKQGRVPASMFGGKYMIERDKLEMFKTNYDRRPGRKRSARLMIAPDGPAAPPPSRPSFGQWLDIVEAAQELQIHPQSLRRLIKQGRIEARFFGGKYLIARDQLEAFKTNYDPRPGRKRSARLI